MLSCKNQLVYLEDIYEGDRMASQPSGLADVMVALKDQIFLLKMLRLSSH